MSERNGRYMHTATGRKFWPMDPRPAEVEIETIAHHLATKCRYAGAVQHPWKRGRIFYSVAEHSVFCSYIVPQTVALEALLHDASEAYNGDLIRPLKYDDAFSAPFKLVEERNEDAIAQRFGLQWPWPEAIKTADEMVTAAEVNQIVPKDPDEEWVSGKLHDDTAAADIEIEMWLPFEAKTRFLQRFHELWQLRRARAA